MNGFNICVITRGREHYVKNVQDSFFLSNTLGGVALFLTKIPIAIGRQNANKNHFVT